MYQQSWRFVDPLVCSSVVVYVGVFTARWKGRLDSIKRGRFLDQLVLQNVAIPRLTWRCAVRPNTLRLACRFVILYCRRHRAAELPQSAAHARQSCWNSEAERPWRSWGIWTWTWAWERTLMIERWLRGWDSLTVASRCLRTCWSWTRNYGDACLLWRGSKREEELLSRQTSVLALFKSSSGTRASPPVMLDIGDGGLLTRLQFKRKCLFPEL